MESWLPTRAHTVLHSQMLSESVSPNPLCDITVSVSSITGSATDYICPDVHFRAPVEWVETLLIMCLILLVKSIFI